MPSSDATLLDDGNKEFKSTRLTLRNAQYSDLEALHAFCSDSEVMRYWSRPADRTLDATSEWLQSLVKRPTEFVICLKETPDVPIGKIGVWRDSEIGFLLHRQWWRKGIMSEAMEVLLPWLFRRKEGGGLGLDRLTADVDPRNEASLRFLNSFGFVVTGTKEKTWEVAGEWVDSVFLELKRDQLVEHGLLLCC